MTSHLVVPQHEYRYHFGTYHKIYGTMVPWYQRYSSTYVVLEYCQTKELVESGTIKTTPLCVQSVLDGLWRPLGKGLPYRKDAGLSPHVLCPSSTNSR